MKHYPGYLLGLSMIILLVAACNKKPEQVGLGLQPASVELSVVFDNTSGLLAHSVREDSVRTDGNAIKTAMLGSMLDPTFGKTTAQIFSQFRLSENGHNFGDTLVIVDSLVLSLTYSGFYGDTLSPQTIKVYELSEDMDQDSSYYSHQSIADDGNEIASVTFVPTPADSVRVGDDLKAPQLRIPLSMEFAEKIINADGTVFDNNDSWLDFMKGLRIKTEPVSSAGGILLFDMLASNSLITIYYRSGNPSDTLSFEFLSNSNCARFTAFEHNDYLQASSELMAQIIDGDTSLGEDRFYLQGMGGVKAQLRLPDIEKYFEDGAVAINEAKLIFNIYDNGSELEPPPQLGLAMIDEDGDYVPLPDASEVSSYYGGYLNDAGTQYYFRISRYVQQILTGQSPNYPLALLVSGGSFRPNQVIFHGTGVGPNAEKRLILNVTYTKVN